jgi:hypothetical protein
MGSAAASRRSPGRGSLWRRHSRAITAALAVLVAAAFAHYVLPHILALGPTLGRLRQGHVVWLAVGVALEACSLLGEVALFRAVFARPGNRIGWTTSAEITLAGAAATKLVAAAGAGGVAVTAWGLRASGLSAAEVADGMVCFGILTYGVYVAAVAVCGIRALVRAIQRSRSPRSDPGPRRSGYGGHPRRPVSAVRKPTGHGVSRATGRAVDGSREQMVAPRRRGTTRTPRRPDERGGDDQAARSVAPGCRGLLGL